MQFVFPLAIQQGINSGVYKTVISNAGVPLGIARNAVTGQFVGHAVQAVATPFLSISSLLTGGLSLLGDGILGFQMNRGFQKTYERLNQVQNSLGVLQATTSLIGVTSVAGVALSAVNLHQTLKLKKEVEELKYQVKDGFIQVLEEVRYIPDTIKFDNHRTILMMAYGEFIQATKLIKLALSTENKNARYSTLSNAQLHLSNANNAYSKPELFEATTAAAQLRRLECAWMIEQTQAINFQLMNAPESASHCLHELQQQIQTQFLELIDGCSCEEELAFLYPEITRIQTQDIPIFDTWKNQIDYVQQLSVLEKEEINNLASNTDSVEEMVTEEFDLNSLPIEVNQYCQSEQLSHYESLLDQLRYTVNTNIRQDHLDYIKDKAVSTNLQGIVPVNLEQVSDLTIANIYNYLKTQKSSV